MTRKRSLRLLAPLVALGVALAIAGSAVAGRPAHAGQDSGLSIYRGDSKETSGVAWDSWGSGKAEEETHFFYSGSRSLKIVTHGLYQGVALTLARPANLGAYVANQDAYLQFAVLVAQTAGAGGAGGGRPGGSGGGLGGPGLGGAAGGRPGGGAGRPGGGQGRNAKAKEPKDLENLRVLLVTTDNQPIEFLLPLEYATDDNHWKLLSIPVSVLPGIKPETQIKEIRLFGDQPATFYLGQIRVVIDGTPISVDHIQAVVVPRNEKHSFIGKASAGYTPLRYSWDWNVADGIQDEGEGRVLSHAFHKSGDFIAALIVTDVYGIKASKSVQFSVTVTP